MKKIAVSLAIALLFSCAAAIYSAREGEKIASGIVRLHVIAASDTAEDQALKLTVRDAILARGAKLENKAQAQAALGEIEKAAKDALCESGSDYSVRAEYGRYPFPTKSYDGFALPAGRYDAVRVVIGEGKGKNWWCVLFPPLCYVDGATDTAAVREALGEEYDVLNAPNGTLPVKIKFKFLEILNHENENT